LDAAEAQAEANFRLAQLTQERADLMLKNNTIAQQEYDQATSTYQANKANLDLVRQQRKDARITAPFDGITGARMVSPGQVISRNSAITTLVDLDTVKAEFQVPERFLGQLATGQAIAFRVPAYPGQSFTGVGLLHRPRGRAGQPHRAGEGARAESGGPPAARHVRQPGPDPAGARGGRGDP
jgi:membrane fusion protein (multidrug efflux system)